MRCTRLLILSVFKSQTCNLCHCIRANDLFGTLRYRSKHGGQIQILMTGQLHLIRAYLTCNGNQGRTIQESICHTGYQIGSARTECRQTYTCSACQPSIYICHKGCSLLVSGIYKMNTTLLNGKHQIQCLFSGDAKYSIYTFFP